MSSRALGSAIALALLALLAYLLDATYRPDEVKVVADEVVVEAQEVKRPAVRVKVPSCEKTQMRIQLQGYVENIGNTDLSYVTVSVLWKNDSGRVIATDTVYAVKDQPLAPGERRDFVAATENSSVSRCNAELLDFWA
jgi:energy-converting hydrogenase Eha subunit F